MSISPRWPRRILPLSNTILQSISRPVTRLPQIIQRSLIQLKNPIATIPWNICVCLLVIFRWCPRLGFWEHLQMSLPPTRSQAPQVIRGNFSWSAGRPLHNQEFSRDAIHAHETFPLLRILDQCSPVIRLHESIGIADNLEENKLTLHQFYVLPLI